MDHKKTNSRKGMMTRPLSLRAAAGAAMLLLGTAAAHAQSSVTLYGIVDAGVGYISNLGGKTSVQQITGTIQNNRLGFKGTEDLGGGTSALFVLENGFSVNNGTLGQGGKLFGRQSWVGLTNKQYGTVSLGNQYDLLGNTLSRYETSGFLLGNFSDHPFGNDRANDLRVNNAVRYMTPLVAGFQAGAMYAFSNLAGDVNGVGRSYSYDVTYDNGPFSIGVAYVEVAGTTLDISSLTGRATGTVVVGGSYLRSTGVGASYSFAKAKVYAMYTQALYAGLRGSGQANTLFRNAHVGGTYNFSPALAAGLAYAITAENSVQLHQLSSTLDYALSKRTDVYAQAFWQHAQGTNAHASIINVGGSSGPNQVIVDVGIRHKF